MSYVWLDSNPAAVVREGVQRHLHQGKGETMNVIRDYVWDTFGESVRGVEVTVAVVLLTALQDVGNVTDLGSWATGVGVAVIVAVAAYVKGRLPATQGDTE